MMDEKRDRKEYGVITEGANGASKAGLRRPWDDNLAGAMARGLKISAAPSLCLHLEKEERERESSA